jgi:hypothetical protein
MDMLETLMVVEEMQSRREDKTIKGRTNSYMLSHYYRKFIAIRYDTKLFIVIK